jgi:hypothetical protein
VQFEAQTQQRDITIHAKDQREAIFYFGGGGELNRPGIRGD